MRIHHLMLAISLTVASAIPARANPVTCDMFLTWQEAQVFSYLHPSMKQYLDADNDGESCEHLRKYLRTDGNLVSSGSICNGWMWEIWEAAASNSSTTTRFYGKVWLQQRPNALVFTTGDFKAQNDVYQYLKSWYFYKDC